MEDKKRLDRVNKTTIHISKELLTELKEVASKIVGYDLYITSEKSVSILLKEYKKITEKK